MFTYFLEGTDKFVTVFTVSISWQTVNQYQISSACNEMNES